MSQKAIALLGRKDEPTDAVEEYCRYLASALLKHEIELEIHRVPWELHGWTQALHDLRSKANGWCHTWVLVQYTALAGSARGCPTKVLLVLRILKSAGARVGAGFHDVEPYSGTRLIDRFRHSIQIHAMRRARSPADLAIFTVPPEQLSWPPAPTPQAVFIPVGPNLPIPIESLTPPARSSTLTIGVFSITSGESGARETQYILSAVRHASQAIGKLRLSVFGRHAELREAALRTSAACP